MCTATDQGADNPKGPGDKILMSTETSCHLDRLLQVLKTKQKKNSVYDFIHFFHDFIHVYIPREGADNSLGTKF